MDQNRHIYFAGGSGYLKRVIGFHTSIAAIWSERFQRYRIFIALKNPVRVASIIRWGFTQSPTE